ncbi:reticulon-like protein B17 [Cornus florida]|uniref:reticulon-like protein B17 n=1 Tax=Cornus florida TaxID=4283 RepID=UPI0028978DAC|nr:reticulon-like protein B17 [Cornus florida]
MDSTPPSHQSDPRSRIKSASRLSRITHFDDESDETPQHSLHLVPSSPKIAANLSPSSPSPRPPNSLPIRELLLLSPSPLRRSKTRLAERLESAEEPVDPSGPRRRHRTRNGATGVLGCASPRGARRSRKRLEQEIREEKDLGMAEEMPKARKRRHSGRPKKDKLSLVPSNPSPKTNDWDRCNLDRVGQLIIDLIIWKDMAKSTLWFGFGSLCFLSSCFAGGINFSIFSMISQLSLLFLGVSFFSNSICQRDSIENKPEFELKEDDILRAARLLLPAANLALLRTRRLFSGEPSMTLKVAPFLLMGAEYGHLITLWRLSALGFFISFTGPKLYSCYSVQMNKRVECFKWWVLEAWGACSHKKFVAASAVTAFWNLTSIKTRIIAAFISLVILRYYRQHSKLKEGEAEEGEQEQQHQALVVVETGSQKCL